MFVKANDRTDGENDMSDAATGATGATGGTGGTNLGGAKPPSRLPLDWIAASLRRERTRAGLSLSELAKRAGIAKSTLSQLEAASGNPSMETLWALGVALGVPFSALIEAPAPAVQVLRAGEGPTVHSEQSSYTAVLLSASPPGARRDIYRTQLEPGSVRASDPHIPGTVEHLIVSTGRVKAGPRGEEVELGPGDYLAFRGDVPHSYEALAPGTAFVLVMQHV
ncbi:toxin-antitoxin system, antitoxin component, Xre family [Streptomyces ipomoeae 91-03]|uniref:Toxin-antitoxin system, antitoxin component, Xre family n=2 Tax=Streptomyces ipomoeae TaxID=103232 RepID=L1KIU8_9ACTN|nr:toxin-antitoxin system, antitoxin component, Xre family [Streptomyces ipomoeae 91-03]